MTNHSPILYQLRYKEYNYCSANKRILSFILLLEFFCGNSFAKLLIVIVKFYLEFLQRWSHNNNLLAQECLKLIIFDVSS
jgi:hypothetical protein